MNELFYNLKERIAYYRETQRTRDFNKNSDYNTDPEETSVYPIVQNRTLDVPFRIMISIYETNGIETSYYSDQSYRFKHMLPFTGVLHKHEFVEIFYVIDGYFEQILLGEKYHFEAGDFVITDQNCEHSDYLVAVDSSVLFLQINSDYLDDLLHYYDECDELHKFLFHVLRKQNKEQSFLRLQNTGDGTRRSDYILERLFEELSHRELGYPEIFKGLLLRLLQNLCINYRPILRTNTKESKEKALLYEIERFIRLNYSTVNSSVLEETFHYHRNYYNLLIKKYRGVTFKNYLLDIRMRQANELLQTTSLPIKEIARMVGYENTSHFYHLYEDKYGHVPRHDA